MAKDENNFLTNINPIIQKNIEARQSSDGRKTYETWFKSRTPWARATSMVHIEGNPDLRNKWILYNGISQTAKDFKSSTLREFYDPTDYNRPLPGMTEAEVKNKNTFGSVREAIIRFTCWSQDQLNIMEKLYMSLGMPILLEWGWNCTLDGTPINDTLYLEDPKDLSLQCIDKKIKKYVNFYEGHYDGMCGLTTDFSWTLREDGGFDCTTTIVSQGEVYLAMNTKSTSKQLASENSSLKDKNEKLAAAENLEAYIWNLSKVLGTVSEGIPKLGKCINFSGQIKTEHDTKGELTKYFITWWALEKILERNISYTFADKTENICDDGTSESWAGDENWSQSGDVAWVEEDRSRGIYKNTPSISGNVTYGAESGNVTPGLGGTMDATDIRVGVLPKINEETIRAENKKNILNLYGENGGFDEKTPFYPTINNSTLVLNYLEGVRSLNPNICIIPVVSNIIYMDDGKGTYDQPINLLMGDGGKSSDATAIRGFEAKFVDETSSPPNRKIYLKDILINLNFFYESYKKTEHISDLLLALLNGITEACGELWNFQLMVDEDKSFAIRILEENSVSPDAFVQPEILKEFKVYHQHSAVRKAELVTNVPSDTKNRILLDAFANKKRVQSGGMGPTFVNTSPAPKDYQSKGYIQFFDSSVYSALKENNMIPVKIGTGVTGEVATQVEKNKIDKQIYEQLRDAYKKISNDGFTDALMSDTLSILKTYISKSTFLMNNSIQTIFDNKNFGFLPLNLTLTLDGISGLKWGDKVLIDYIPDRYKDGSAFSIVNVKHKISPNDWMVDVETIFRVIKRPSTSQESPVPNSTSQSGISRPTTQETHDKINDVYNNIVKRLNTELSKTGYLEVTSVTGGAHTSDSQHYKGEAVDLVYSENGAIKNDKIKEAAKKINLKYDQLIDEDDHIHISYVEGNNRNSTLKKSGTSYLPMTL